MQGKRWEPGRALAKNPKLIQSRLFLPDGMQMNWGLWNKHPPGKQIGSQKNLVYFSYGGQLVHLSASYVAGTRICLLGVPNYKSK